MNTRERFQAIMNFKPFDRMPHLEWCHWWDKTIDRWHTEGLPAELTDRYDINAHFGLEQYKQENITALGSQRTRPKSHGAAVVSTMEEYEAIRPLLYQSSSFNSERWRQWAKEQATGDAVLWFTVEGPFWFPRVMLGIEGHLYGFYDQPELMKRIIDDLGDYHMRLIDEITAIATPDFMTFAEDLSYNLGPMLSKDMFDKFLTPYYQRIVPALKKHGILTVVDSDGDIDEPTRWFEAVGVEAMLPLERQSGVDVAALRKEHPKMRFIGCFDKLTMSKGEQAMRDEFERLLPVVRTGGFISSVDHQTPPGVSYEQYKVYLRLLREYAQKAASGE